MAGAALPQGQPGRNGRARPLYSQDNPDETGTPGSPRGRGSAPGRRHWVTG